MPEISEIHHFCICSAVDDAHIHWRRIKQGRAIARTELFLKEGDAGRTGIKGWVGE